MKWIRWLQRWLGHGEDRANHVQKEETMCCEPYDPHRLLERVKSALVDLQWKFGEDAERLTLTMGYGARHGVYLLRPSRSTRSTPWSPFTPTFSAGCRRRSGLR